MKQNKEKGKGGLLIAAVDLGTTSLKIAAFSTDGVMEGRAILPYSLKTPDRVLWNPILTFIWRV